MERLTPRLRRLGQTVMVIKHAHHGFAMDYPGKDSFRHRAAGASAVLIVSGPRSALLQEHPCDEPSIHEFIAQLPTQGHSNGALWVLLEGYRHSNLPKFEVCAHAMLHPAPSAASGLSQPQAPAPPARKQGGGSRLQQDAGICAIACPEPRAFQSAHAALLGARPAFDRNDPDAIVAWLMAARSRFEYARPESAAPL